MLSQSPPRSYWTICWRSTLLLVATAVALELGAHAQSDLNTKQPNKSDATVRAAGEARTPIAAPPRHLSRGRAQS
jgi:hypothetical protein